MTEISEPPLMEPLGRADSRGRVMTRKVLDGLTFGSALAGATLMIVLLALLVVVVWLGASPAMHKYGWGFLQSSSWNPVKQRFGAWPVIYGTLVSSALALVIAVPISVGTALFLVRIAPRWLVAPASFLVELLAAIPSIAYGLWGMFFLVPFNQAYVQPFLASTLGKLPAWAGGFLFDNSGGSGQSMLSAGVILAIMIIPIITAVTRDVLRTVPIDIEQGAYGLGATWWQATKLVLAYAKMGILGAIILGLARAIGETMAVTMVIGNSIKVTGSLLGPGQTIASLLANQFNEADTDLAVQSLVYCALILLVIAVLINTMARMLVIQVGRRSKRR